MKNLMIFAVLALCCAAFADSTDTVVFVPKITEAGANLQMAANCQLVVLLSSAAGIGITAGTGKAGGIILFGAVALGFYIAGIYNTYHAGTNLMPPAPVDTTSAGPVKATATPW